VAVLVRIIDGFQEETGSHWSNNYYAKANELNLLGDVDMSNKE
jgi:hypothetical protein